MGSHEREAKEEAKEAKRKAREEKGKDLFDAYVASLPEGETPSVSGFARHSGLHRSRAHKIFHDNSDQKLKRGRPPKRINVSVTDERPYTEIAEEQGVHKETIARHAQQGGGPKRGRGWFRRKLREETDAKVEKYVGQHNITQEDIAEREDLRRTTVSDALQRLGDKPRRRGPKPKLPRP